MRNDVRGRQDDRDAWSVDADDDRREYREDQHRKHAARQMLQHLALGAVVVGGMRRAAGNRRRVEMIVVVGAAVGMHGGVAAMRVEVVHEKRQRAERGPGERDEHAPSDARSPPAGVERR